MHVEHYPTKVGTRAAKRGSHTIYAEVLQSKRVTTPQGKTVTIRLEEAMLKGNKRPQYRIVASHAGEVLQANRTLSKRKAVGQYRRFLKHARETKVRLSR